MCFLLEGGEAYPTGERLLAGVHPQMRFQVPAHAELLPAIRALVLPGRVARRALLDGLAVTGPVLRLRLTGWSFIRSCGEKKKLHMRYKLLI